MIIQGDSLHIPLANESIDSVVTDPPYGISFMNRKWDYDVPSVYIWKEVLRVMKPGAHALVTCGTRTQHRMGVNLEDAGFEIRDVVVWAYGSGFSKSMNLGKAYDKFCGNEREVVETIKKHHIGGVNGNEGWKRPSHFESDGVTPKRTMDITKGQSEYEGWGTALKPAVELWTLCRKPLSEKTIIENVIKHGTGGINIDGCRVDGEPWKSHVATGLNKTKFFSEGEPTILFKEANEQGRFPANLIHDGSDEVVSLFPVTKSGDTKKGTPYNHSGCHTMGKASGFTKREIIGDSGSASRFFYCAKASKSERNKGLDGFDEKETGTYKFREDGSLDGKIPNKKNHHPTVKPVALMRYLCRLITHKNGIVLDPFCGSGSTGVAAKEEGFKFIGIERDREYSNIAYHRYNHQQRNCQIPII